MEQTEKNTWHEMEIKTAQKDTYCARGMLPKDEEIQQKTRTKHHRWIQHGSLQPR